MASERHRSYLEINDPNWPFKSDIFSIKHNIVSPVSEIMTNYKMLIPFGIAILAVGGILLSTSGIAAVSPANKLSDKSMFLGHVELVAKDKDGNIKAYRQTDNIVTYTGKNCAAVRIFGAPSNGTQGTACGGGGLTMNYLAVGTDGTAEAATQTALGLQSGSRIQDTTKGLINGSSVNPYVTLQQTFTPGAVTVQEAGVFDASANGHMFARKQFTGIPLGATDTLTVTWRITLS